MVRFILSIFFSLFICNSVFAGPCDLYKIKPEVRVKKANWNITISPSDKDIWPEAGYVNVVPFDFIVPAVSYTYNGRYYCVYLNFVDATVGFKDFNIIIDKKYKEGSCEYNAVLAHEKHHIKDAENAFENVFSQIKGILQESVDSVEPIYTENAEEVPYAVEKLQKTVRYNKKLQDLVEQFKEQQTKDAKALDSVPDVDLRKCEEDKLKAAFDKFYKEKENEKTE